MRKIKCLRSWMKHDVIYTYTRIYINKFWKWNEETYLSENLNHFNIIPCIFYDRRMIKWTKKIFRTGNFNCIQSASIKIRRTRSKASTRQTFRQKSRPIVVRRPVRIFIVLVPRVLSFSVTVNGNDADDSARFAPPCLISEEVQTLYAFTPHRVLK